MSDINSHVLTQGLADLLDSHDPKRDLSARAEGTFQAISVLAESPLGAYVEVLSAAIIRTCKKYKQVETIGRGTETQEWPTNRYALETLKKLGMKKPVA